MTGVLRKRSNLGRNNTQTGTQGGRCRRRWGDDSTRQGMPNTASTPQELGVMHEQIVPSSLRRNRPAHTLHLHF